MEYDLYHDESKEDGYWHGILLIPANTRVNFLNYLQQTREITNYVHSVYFKRLKNKGKKFNCIRTWIQLGIGSLMQYFKNESYTVLAKEAKRYSAGSGVVGTDYKEIFKIDRNEKIIGAKFILFRDRDAHSKMGNNYPDFTAKIETTCRMGLTGGIHWLGDDEHPIKIKSIHFDGYKHYGRKIDRERIMGRIRGLRDYCSFEENIPIYEGTSNHNKQNCQEYDDCQFLQLTDLLVGGFRTILGNAKNNIQKEVSLPIEELVNKWQGGYKRMKNSRWFKGFWTSECWLENDGWKFNDFQLKNDKQRKLI
jgi:hypothetical protein